MADSSWWWLAAGALIALELVSGTFYLLMIALGLAAAALAALGGAGQVAQWVSAALVGGGAVAAWWGWQRTHPADRASDQAAQAMDVGETVEVLTWQPDGRTAVKYRGAHWDAVLAPGAQALPGSHRIVGTDGNRLILQPIHPS